jgi:hypothetical protein
MTFVKDALCHYGLVHQIAQDVISLPGYCGTNGRISTSIPLGTREQFV